jgi:hypothetical protein
MSRSESSLPYGGTGGSDPVPSSAVSVANLTSSDAHVVQQRGWRNDSIVEEAEAAGLCGCAIPQPVSQIRPPGIPTRIEHKPNSTEVASAGSAGRPKGARATTSRHGHFAIGRVAAPEWTPSARWTVASATHGSVCDPGA